MPLGLDIDEAHLIGQGVQVVYFFFAAPVLPGKLAVEFVDAVEQATKEDGEVGQLVELLLFFQPGRREEADGEVAVDTGLLMALAGVSDGRPVYKVAGGGDERVAGSQAGLAAAAQGVNGRDAVDAKTAQSFAAAGADAVALPGFVDGQDDVGQVMEAVAEEGEGEAEAIAGFQAMVCRDGRDDGIGANNGAGVEVGGEQPAGGADGGVGGVGGAVGTVFGAGGAAHDVGQGVAQVVAGVVVAHVDGGGGGAVEAEVGEL